METISHGRHLALAGTIAVLAALVAGSPAYAKGPCLKNGGPSSVQQYVEQLPQACGSSATGTGNQQRKLPASIAHKIDQQSGNQATADLLKNIATSQSYGAPTQKIKVRHKLSETQRNVLSDSKARHSSALSASVGVVTDGSDSRLLALVILMGVITVFVLVSAVRRHRVRR
jgi:hypothetical protein